jgi:hypothetical protein
MAVGRILVLISATVAAASPGWPVDVVTGIDVWRQPVGDFFDVIMAAYSSTGPAEQDFDALVQLVKDKTVASEGVILVEHDADGQVRVTHTGDHLGRKGLGVGGRRWRGGGPVLTADACVDCGGRGRWRPGRQVR